MSEKNVTLKELIQNIDFRLTHIEDISADNRKLIVKLIKQGNTIVSFLKQLDDEEIESFEMELPDLPNFSKEESKSRRINR